MALVLKDRVRESSTSSGTGSITLAGAYTGYQTFNSVVANGSTVYYTIHNTTSPNDGEWEVGVGTFTSPSTLSRDTVLSSSAGGTTKVSFSGSSTLEVFITQPAEQAVYINEATGFVEAFGNGTNTISFTDINTASLTANTVTLTAGTISTNAANATDIVNKQYVDGIVAAGVHYHAPVLVESPTALNATYNQPGGAGNGVGATLTNAGANVALVIDGVTLSNTARVLVYTQSNAAHNGVYTVTNEGAPDSPGPGSAWVLTRATDADTYVIDSPTGLSEGSTFFVQSGNTGAGETYTCNTTGVITFGSTNITFAQISSAQIYSAGTGLSLTNTTFSISNTAVTAAQYGNDGNVAQITVNAQGQLTNAANVAINASSITVGTLANARTTASDANGASTIVARDATGSFTANIITATDVNSTNVTATTGSFTNVSGNGSAISAINASNISSGTIANARTTASDSNSASTIVARDANGSFGANIITATFSGNAAGLSAINASNISSGTIANARTTAASANGASTIVLRDSGGSFDTNTVNAVSLIGNASQVTAINASNISSGTIANTRTTASSSNGASTIVLRDAGGAFAAGAITGTSFSGNGAAITAINASAITTGTIDNARTTASSANGASTIVARDSGGNFSANTITATTFSGAMSGNGAALTNINASNISSGTIANARTTASDANGASTIVSRDANGSFAANIITHGAGSNTAPSITTAGDTNTGIFFPAADTIAFTEGGVESMRIDSSGNVGIGDSSPNARLHVHTSTATDTTVLINNGATGDTGGIRLTTLSSAEGQIFHVNQQPLAFGTNNTERMRITSAGNLGIGTSSPSTLLTVGDGAAATRRIITLNGGANAGIGALIDLQLGGTSAGYLATSNWAASDTSSDLALFANASRGIRFYTNATECMRIHSSGGVSIGNTTDPGATNLSVTGTIAGNGAPLTGINASNISSGTIANARTTAATANGASTIVLRGASGEFSAGAITSSSISGNGAALTDINASNISSGTISNARTTAASANGASTIVARDANGSFSGNVVTATTFSGSGSSITALGTGTSYQIGSLGVGTAASGTTGEIRATNNVTAFYSDERLKTKTGDIEKALDKVCQIETLLYHANDVAVALGYDASIQEVGVTAQSVQKVQPEVVVPAPIDEKYLTVRYEKLVPLLIEAIKELKAEVDALKGK